MEAGEMELEGDIRICQVTVHREWNGEGSERRLQEAMLAPLESSQSRLYLLRHRR